MVGGADGGDADGVYINVSVCPDALVKSGLNCVCVSVFAAARVLFITTARSRLYALERTRNFHPCVCGANGGVCVCVRR